MSIEPLYACVHVPEFATQARLRNRPQAMSKAIVILDGVAPLEQVFSATRRALQCGVRYGMTRVELDSFPDVDKMPRSVVEERAARAAFAECAGVFTPNMQMLADTARACTMVLDMAGTGAMFGSAAQMMQRLRGALKKQGMFARVAVSCNFHAAVCAAPYAGRTGMLIAKGEESAALRALPLAAVRPTEQQASTFAVWGLQTCGDLAALPETELIARMGQAGKVLRLLARGEHTHLLVPEVEEFLLEERVTLDSPVELLDSLLFVLGPMLDQLIVRAGARSLALASVTVTLGLDGAVAQDSSEAVAAASEHVRTVKPALPLMDREALLKLVHLDLQAHPPSAAVTALHVRAEPGDRSKVQLGLFSPQLPEPTRLDITLARIAALVGERGVGRARLRDTHLPDAFTMERFTSPTGLCALPAVKDRTSAVLRRLRPPVLLRLRLENSRPAAFVMEGRQYAVNAAYGPWRSSGSWWSQEIWSRDEWDIRALAGEGDVMLGVLVHDLLRSTWHLESLYD